MQPVPAGYLARIARPHDARIAVNVRKLDGYASGSLDAVFVDGQIDIGDEGRTASLTLHDPDYELGLDSEDPRDGALFFDRMVEATHTIEVAGTPVTVVGFVGPLVKASREGDTLRVECADKSVLASTGVPATVCTKGMNAVLAIERFMRVTGETRFRLPRSTRRLPRDFAIGWTSPPWGVCRIIANQVLGMQLSYSADGWLTLRRPPTSPSVTFRPSELLTNTPAIEYDASEVRNYVRVTGKRADRKKTTWSKGKKTVKTVPGKAFTVGVASRNNMSPPRLGRGSRPRYLPEIVDDDAIRTDAEARRRAAAILTAKQSLIVSAAWSGVPLYHLDDGDMIELETSGGTVRTYLRQASIPLGASGDASYGLRRSVSRPRRTGKRALL